MHLCLCSEGYSIFLGRNVVGLWSAINIGWAGSRFDIQAGLSSEIVVADRQALI